MTDARPPGELDDADQEILSRLAEWVVERHMAVPAILFLESHRPLSFVGSQALIFASPIVDFFEPFIKGLLGKGYTHADYKRFAELMEHRENLEVLIIEVERANQRQRVKDKAEKVQRKALKREIREKKKALRQSRRKGSDE